MSHPTVGDVHQKKGVEHVEPVGQMVAGQCVADPTFFGLPQALAAVVSGQVLSAEQSCRAFQDFATQVATPARIASFLTALRMRGETESELLGAAQAMQQIAQRFSVAELQLLDTCGTGGDGSSSLNISTMAALVCASLGLPVAKHGNRSVSSRCGSADILEALGVSLQSSPQIASEHLREHGFAFLFAPYFHPHIAKVAAVRKELGYRTIFNLLGPLLNPAGASFQLLGVFDPNWMAAMARISIQLGSQRCLCVHGADGWDELTPWGSNRLVLTDSRQPQSLREWSLDFSSLGWPSVTADDVRGGDAAENLQATWQILLGDEHPGRVLVCLNAAAAILLVREPEELDRLPAWDRAFAECQGALQSGRVRDYLRQALGVQQRASAANEPQSPVI